MVGAPRRGPARLGSRSAPSSVRIILDGALYHGRRSGGRDWAHDDRTEGPAASAATTAASKPTPRVPNIALRAIEEIEAGAVSRLPSLVRGDLSKITAQTVTRRPPRRRPRARVSRHRQFLASARQSPHVFTPEVVVVCGAYLACDHLFLPLPPRVARRAFKPAWRRAASCRRARRTAGSTAPPRCSWTDAASGLMSASLVHVVWDQIHGRDPLTSGDGGVGRNRLPLGGFDASLPPDWESCPHQVDATSLRGGRVGDGCRGSRPGRCIDVPAPNNRVLLHYQSAERRCERMSAGCRRGPGWSWPDGPGSRRALPELHLGFRLARAPPRHCVQDSGVRSTRTCTACSRHAPRRNAHAATAGSCVRVVRMLRRRAAQRYEMRQLSPDALSLSATPGRRRIDAGGDSGPKGAAYVAGPGFDGWPAGATPASEDSSRPRTRAFPRPKWSSRSHRLR